MGYGLISHFGSWILLLEDHKPAERASAAWANYYHRNNTVSIGGIFVISDQSSDIEAHASPISAYLHPNRMAENLAMKAINPFVYDAQRQPSTSLSSD
ncbi:hypothetical protein ACIPW4_12955 [Pseudomonas sp. NPDC089996]|uniref:hypothetical protein n=1 Tax=Pseudomonas sp. NPDC089996 TaxID=3364474 RepID=UPI0038117DF6